LAIHNQATKSFLGQQYGHFDPFRLVDNPQRNRGIQCWPTDHPLQF